MIGNLDDAALACSRDLDVYASGCDRYVYLINGVIYKVESVYGYDAKANTLEMSNYLSLLPLLPDNLRVPATTLYWVDNTPVIAQEFIEGQPVAECYCLDNEAHDNSCMTQDEIEMIRPFLDDVGGLNVIRQDGIYYLIDLAEDFESA